MVGTRKDAAQEKATLGDVEKQLEAMGNMNCIFCDEDLEVLFSFCFCVLTLTFVGVLASEQPHSCIAS